MRGLQFEPGREASHADRPGGRSQHLGPGAAQHLAQRVGTRSRRGGRRTLAEAGLPGHRVGEIDDVGEVEADQPASAAGDRRDQHQPAPVEADRELAGGRHPDLAVLVPDPRMQRVQQDVGAASHDGRADPPGLEVEERLRAPPPRRYGRPRVRGG